VPGRAGELGGPEDSQFGAGFGTTGPDSGYALSLIRSRQYEVGGGEHRVNTDAGLAAVASARAALFRRGPTAKDVDAAMVLLGLDPELPEQIRVAMNDKRIVWFAAAGHHATKLYGFAAALDPDVLRLTSDEARSKMAQGTPLINY